MGSIEAEGGAGSGGGGSAGPEQNPGGSTSQSASGGTSSVTSSTGGASGSSGAGGGSTGAGGSAGAGGSRGCTTCQWSFVGSEEGILGSINAEHDLLVANDIVYFAALSVRAPHNSPEAWRMSLGSYEAGQLQALSHVDVVPMTFPSLSFSKGALLTTLNHASAKKLFGGAWSDIGSPPPGRDEWPAPIVADSNGTPYMVHTDGPFSTLLRFDEPKWTEIGSARELPVRRTALAVDGNDNLYAAYVDSGLLSVSVEKLSLRDVASGADFVALGSAGFRTLPYPRHFTPLAVSRAGVPYMAFVTADGQSVVVMTFDGEDWVQLGEPLGGSGVTQGEEPLHVTPSIAVAPDGSVHVTYRGIAEATGEPAMLVGRWNGERWLALDERGFTKDEVRFVKLTFASNGTAYVGYVRQATDPSLIVRRLD